MPDSIGKRVTPEVEEITPASHHAPRVWLLAGEKRGDNAQVRSLAKAVGWAYEEKQIVVAEHFLEAKPPVRPSLDHIDRAQSDAIEGPWPDLVLLAGRRLASVGLFIKAASGGRTKLVVVGKPRGRARDFDLIVIASHYVMRDAPNVARHDLPLMEPDPERLAEAKKAWVGRLLLLQRPLTAVLVGGPTGGLRFDVAVARQLLEESLAVVRATRGSLYITTSRRTPPEISAWLKAHVEVPAQLYLYDEHAPPEENPYLGLLALAENFVVSSDSLSMMVEVARLGRPLRILPLARAAGPLESGLARLGLLRAPDPRRDPIPAGGLLARTLAGLGWPIHSRDLSAVARRLVAADRASWLGDPVDWRAIPGPFEDDSLVRVAARIRAMVDV